MFTLLYYCRLEKVLGILYTYNITMVNLDSNLINNDPLRTNTRLGNIINEYNSYLEELEKDNKNYRKSSTPGQPDFVPKYNYYHFQLSPEGIDSTNLGCIVNNPFSNYLPKWSKYQETNTTNSWFITLGDIQKKIKQSDMQHFNLKKKSGIMIEKYILKSPLYSVDKYPDYIYSVNTNIPVSQSEMPAKKDEIQLKTIFQNTSTLENYMDTCIATKGDFEYLHTTLPTTNNNFNQSILKDTNSSSLEQAFCKKFVITSYVYPNKSGYYSFSYENDPNTYIVAWLGDVSFGEYTYQNSSLNIKTNTSILYLTSDKPQLLRVHIYKYISSEIASNIQTDGTNVNLVDPYFKISFSFKGDTPGNSVLSPTPSIPIEGNLFYSCLKNNKPFLFTLIYAAFVSYSPQSYKLGKFLCYSLLNKDNDIEYSDQLSLYEILSVFKFPAQKGIYEVYQKDFQLGTLPNGVKYTLYFDGVGSLPYCYNIYRLNTDPRMGNTYQIDTVANSNNQYEMKELPSKYMSQGKSYTLFEQYYPDAEELKNAITTNGLVDGLPKECEDICNKNDDCNYYYSFVLENSNGKTDMCFIDSKKSQPDFNQINPNVSKTQNIENRTSNLFIRNNEFSEIVKKQCSQESKSNEELINLQPIIQTTQYKTSFPYSNYYISDKKIDNIEDIGTCGPKKKLNKINNCFKSVLSIPGEYTSDGSFLGNNEECMFKEGFTIDTDAIENTQNQGISYVQLQEQKFKSINDKISDNYQEIKDKISQYKKDDNEFIKQGVYDKLLYDKLVYVGKPIKNVEEKKISDNNSLFLSQNLLFVLGVLTVLILLVLVCMI